MLSIPSFDTSQRMMNYEKKTDGPTHTVKTYIPPLAVDRSNRQDITEGILQSSCTTHWLDLMDTIRIFHTATLEHMSPSNS